MFNGFTNFGHLMGMYTGSPLMGAVNSAFYYKYDPNYYNGSLNGLAPIFLALAPFFLMIMLLGFAISVLLLVSWWKVFEKAGRPGWAAIIPIYNLVVILQMVGMSPWLVLTAFIPGVGGIIFFIVSIYLNTKLAKAFGKTEGFAIGLILVPFVFVPMLAFDNSRFSGVPPTTSYTPPTPPPPPSNPTPNSTV